MGAKHPSNEHPRLIRNPGHILELNVSVGALNDVSDVDARLGAGPQVPRFMAGIVGPHRERERLPHLDRLRWAQQLQPRTAGPGAVLFRRPVAKTVWAVRFSLLL